MNEFTHPAYGNGMYWRERVKAMWYDEEHLRLCIACLINNIVADMRGASNLNTTSAYRVSINWKNKDDCFKYLALKISVLGNRKMQVRCWVDVWDGEFK